MCAICGWREQGKILCAVFDLKNKTYSYANSELTMSNTTLHYGSSVIDVKYYGRIHYYSVILIVNRKTGMIGCVFLCKE